MKFCDACQSIMKKVIVRDSIFFQCVCGEEIPSEASDTLLVEIPVSSQEVQTENSAFIENCTDDPAANIVPLSCECGMDHLVMIDVLDTIRYVCPHCKKMKTHSEYEKWQMPR